MQFCKWRGNSQLSILNRDTFGQKICSCNPDYGFTWIPLLLGHYDTNFPHILTGPRKPQFKRYRILGNINLTTTVNKTMLLFICLVWQSATYICNGAITCSLIKSVITFTWQKKMDWNDRQKSARLLCHVQLSLPSY